MNDLDITINTGKIGKEDILIGKDGDLNRQEIINGRTRGIVPINILDFPILLNGIDFSKLNLDGIILEGTDTLGATGGDTTVRNVIVTALQTIQVLSSLRRDEESWVDFTTRLNLIAQFDTDNGANTVPTSLRDVLNSIVDTGSGMIITDGERELLRGTGTGNGSINALGVFLLGSSYINIISRGPLTVNNALVDIYRQGILPKIVAEGSDKISVSGLRSFINSYATVVGVAPLEGSARDNLPATVEFVRREVFQFLRMGALMRLSALTNGGVLVPQDSNDPATKSYVDNIVIGGDGSNSVLDAVNTRVGALESSAAAIPTNTNAIEALTAVNIQQTAAITSLQQTTRLEIPRSRISKRSYSIAFVPRTGLYNAIDFIKLVIPLAERSSNTLAPVRVWKLNMAIELPRTYTPTDWVDGLIKHHPLFITPLNTNGVIIPNTARHLSTHQRSGSIFDNPYERDLTASERNSFYSLSALVQLGNNPYSTLNREFQTTPIWNRIRINTVITLFSGNSLQIVSKAEVSTNDSLIQHLKSQTNVYGFLGTAQLAGFGIHRPQTTANVFPNIQGVFSSDLSYGGLPITGLAEATSAFV